MEAAGEANIAKVYSSLMRELKPVPAEGMRDEGPDEGPFFEEKPGHSLDSETLESFGFPIRGFEGEKTVGSIIGVGYLSFEHASEQVQYRGISRTVKRYLGRDLSGDSSLAIYCGWGRRPLCNDAIGWEAARLSGKSGGRIGIASSIGYPVEHPYDRILHMPYLTESHHPIGLALTVDASLSEDGRLVVMGPSDRGGREEVIELTRSQAAIALQDKLVGQRLVNMRNWRVEDQARLRTWQFLKWSLQRIQRGESPHSPRFEGSLQQGYSRQR